MSQTLRDGFSRELDDAGRFDVDVEALVDRGETRLRRRRLTAVLGAAAAVAIVAMAIGLSALSGTQAPRPGPSHHPPQHEETPSKRPIVYSDVTWRGPSGLVGDPIHVGGRLVETGGGFVHMAVTDDGVVYATGGYRDDGRLWFTNGGTPVQVASHACPSAHGWPGSIITGNSGSLVAWFDCSPEQDPRNPDLIVYDTSAGREVGSVQDPGCSTSSQATEQDTDRCSAIIGDRVYVKDGVYTARGGVLVSSDDETASRSFAEDIRDNPRALVVGDSWDTGTPTLSGVFVTVGRRLVPIKDEHLTSAFDTATRQPVQFLLPPGYQPDSQPEASTGDGANYGLFEWLDDDTIALESYRTGRHDQDILTCRISTGRCELTVPSLGRDRAYRVVQNENLGSVQFEL